jgi:hypothetical protein
VRGCKLSQFKVMGGEQTVSTAICRASKLAMPLASDEPIVSGGAAPYLVHQHQAVGCRGVEDLRGLGHLEHEGRLRIRQIVSRTYAGVNRINGT